MRDVDPELIRRCQRGEAAAFEELVRTTHRDVYTLALRLVASPEDAKDVTQEVFLRVHRSVLGFRGASKFGTWLHRVTVNCAISCLRKRAARSATANNPFADLADPRTELGPESSAERAELSARIGAALATLSDTSRTVVVLRDVEGLSTEEVAELTGMSPGAVRVRLHRARHQLASILADDDPHAGHDHRGER